MPTTAPMAPRKSARLASKNLTPMRPSISKSPKKSSISEKSSPLKRQGAIRRKDHPKVTKKLGKKKVLGARQSPIDIRKELVQEDVKNCQASCLKISYTLGDCTDVLTCPTGFRVNVAEKCSSILKAKHLPGTYLLAQFHAHWGRDCSCGAEHLLDGMSKAGEVHFVFWNKKYGSFEKALEQGDGLAVLGVLLEEGAHSTSYESLFDVIKRANSTKKTVTLPANFALDELIPKEGYRDFATYLGSLTSPPYCESVIWTVFFEPMIVSKSQLDILRAITPSNYRECQNLKGRIVSSSRKL